MARYRFFMVDVFTRQRFGGNQLAVLPDASGLTTQQMAEITREFNFSESTFVLPPDNRENTCKVRIFSPSGELSFAGHPNVGTAFALAANNLIECQEGVNLLRFEELAGVIAVSVNYREGDVVSCELTAPGPLTTGASLPVEAVAHALHLRPHDIDVSRHQPLQASVGLPFVLTALLTRDALERAQPDTARLSALFENHGLSGQHDAVHLYTHDTDGLDWDLQARMFAVGLSGGEDPATGSANCALAGLLASHRAEPSGTLTWRIAQGIEMGRPSLLDATVDKADGELATIRIAGASVMVAEGQIEA